MKTLRKLLGLCEHKWVILERGPVKKYGVTVAFYYDLQCEHCGNIKTKQA